MAFTIKVNGKAHSVDVDGDTPLLWVLRDVLGMTGTKFGCGMALCGACTVHVDGVATRSCITPVDSSARRRSRRSRRSARRRPAPRSRRPGSTARSPQCGYCQSGQIMSATALLASNPQPDRCRHRRRDVRQHLPLRHLRAHSRSHQAGRRELTGGDHDVDHVSQAAAEPISSHELCRGAVSCRPERAAGGGLHAELQPAACAAGAADADAFAPNAFIRIAADGQVVADHALCRDGPGHLHLDPDADRRRAGGRPRAGALGARAARTKSSTPIRCSACRRPATRTRSAARGSRCARPARPRAPCWWRPRPSAGTSIRRPAARKRGEVLHPPTRTTHRLRRARRRCGRACRCRRR